MFLGSVVHLSIGALLIQDSLIRYCTAKTRSKPKLGRKENSAQAAISAQLCGTKTHTVCSLFIEYTAMGGNTELHC